MTIAIFTEDSGVKYPKMKRDEKLGRGRDIEEIPNFLNTLEKENIQIPSTDLEKEEKYKKILSDFVRPAELMFSGLFKEVRNFYNKLDKITETKLYIISGRYGLVNSEKNIIPYKAYMKNQEDLKKLDKRTDFSNGMVEVANKYDLNLLFLAKRYLNFLISKQILRKINSDIFIVTGSSMKDKIYKYDIDNLRIFRKRGIARISWQNKKEIKNVIKEKYS